MSLEPIGPEEQLKVWKGRAEDTRPSLGTGFPTIDRKLFRDGFQPGTFVLVGGRTHTRKTGVVLNMMSSLLHEGRAVGFVSLDETPPGYIAKLCSVFTYQDEVESGFDAEWLDVNWDEAEAEAARELYGRMAARLTLSRGTRPSFDAMTEWLDDADSVAARPEVVFVDYLALLYRDDFSGAEVQRIPRLAEDLAVWTNENDVVTIAIHQVGRQSDGAGHMNVGDQPCMLEQLKYGGEEMADVVLGTFRPALNHLGNLTYEEAEAWYRKVDVEEWSQAVERVRRYQDSTFLQLLKNRPSQKGLLFRGVELVAPSESMFQREATAEDLARLIDFKEESERAAGA